VMVMLRVAMMSTCNNNICNNITMQWQTLTCVVWCNDEVLIKCYVKCEALCME
jgi:hypothetical protein